METCSLQAQKLPRDRRLCRRNLGIHQRPPNWRSRRIFGLAAIFLAYKVNCALLGGIAAKEMEPTAEESVALARQSGMPGAMVMSLNSLAHDASRA